MSQYATVYAIYAKSGSHYDLLTYVWTEERADEEVKKYRRLRPGASIIVSAREMKRNEKGEWERLGW